VATPELKAQSPAAAEAEANKRSETEHVTPFTALRIAVPWTRIFFSSSALVTTSIELLIYQLILANPVLGRPYVSPPSVFLLWLHGGMELIGLPCSRFMGMVASPACAPGLIFRPTLPPRHVVFRCYWAPKLSSRRRCRRHTSAAAAASARASPATAGDLDADDFRHPLDK
jgi:hypothetical protein